MIKQVLIGSNTVKSGLGNGIMTGNTGRLFAFYTHTFPSNAIVVAYSDNDGDSWTEVTTTLPTSFAKPAVAIDSDDIIHYVYQESTYIVNYNTFNGVTLSFGTPETIFDGTSNTDTIDSTSLTIDKNDKPHIAWAQDRPATSNASVYYSNRVSGSWASRTDLTIGATNYNNSQIRIVVDSDNFITIYADSGNLSYFRYTTTWTTEVNITPISFTNLIDAVATPNGDIYILYYRSATNGGVYYIHYNKSLNIHSSGTYIETSGANFYISSNNASIGLNTEGKLFVIGGRGELRYVSFLNGESSKVATNILLGGDGADVFKVHTSLYPIISSTNSQQIVGENFKALHFNNDTLELYFIETDNKIYSKESNAILSTDLPSDVNLTTLLTATGDSNVAIDDGIYEDQSATSEYSIFYFRNRGVNITDNIVVTWKGKTDLAPSSSDVVLQIYNRATPGWETLDTDSTTGADTDFTLTGTISADMEDYYDDQLWVDCRVYQLMT